MSKTAIRLDGIGKRYSIGARRRYTTLGEKATDLLASPLRRVRRLLSGGAEGAADLTRTFWALRDISLEIPRGEVLGIIGHNGAGKSTLLKILAQITEPTLGVAEVFGRVGSLLEVGTGFHPELTGRENIYLNGAILGMHREETRRKFDEIVAFSEIESFLDTPVKHYSSGMYVRLAFAVAAHIEPEILLVDEVLAVGDLAFQRKCLGKMDNVSKEGRTVLFVTHNMNAIQRLCPRSILLSQGRLVTYGETGDVVRKYLVSSPAGALPGEWIDLSGCSRSGTGRVKFVAVSYRSLNADTAGQPGPDAPLEFSLYIISDKARALGSVAVTLYDQYGTKLVNADTLSLGRTVPLGQGRNLMKLEIERLHLNPGVYTLGLYAADPPSEVHDSIASAFRLEVVDLDPDRTRIQVSGVVPCQFEFSTSGQGEC